MKVFIILLLLFLSSFVCAQTCENYLKCDNCKLLIDKNYKIHPVSKTYYLSSGESESFEWIVYSGMDYKVSICHDDALGNQIIWRILNTNNEVVFDNTNEDFIMMFEFSAILDQNLKIEIIIPDAEPGISKKPIYSGCLGIVVQHVLTPRTGF